MRVTVIMVAGLLAVLLMVERATPLRRLTRPLLGRLFINAVISAVAFATAAMLVRPTSFALLEWTSATRSGIIQLLPMPVPLQFVLSLLLMDLTFYWWHVANHRIPLLWRFHNVHHMDPDLDASTAFRFHCGEIAISTGFRVLQIGAIGLPLWMFLTYELMFQANTLFHHSNVRLPIRLERALNLVLVTPRMHGIHHSQIQDETNSNYSVVFSWWDRMHRTIRLNVPQRDIVIGVPAYSHPSDNRFWTMLLLPFSRQRDYWRPADRAIVRREPATSTGPRSRLAE
jgi:sterol desaturase/sphingolipid hydroxylase (fatty acid hydroxylase superfamily)